MRRPKKKDKKLVGLAKMLDERLVDKIEGYNQCYDEYEKYLPTEEEIAKILTNKIKEVTGTWYEIDAKIYAKAISKRIRGEQSS